MQAKILKFMGESFGQALPAPQQNHRDHDCRVGGQSHGALRKMDLG